MLRLASVLLFASSTWAAEPVVIKLNGQSFRPTVIPVFGSVDEPAEGDLIELPDIRVAPDRDDYHHFHFPLGTERTLELQTDAKSPNLLFRVGPDGKRAVFGARVGPVDKLGVVNPLSDLTPEQIRGLRGIELHGGSFPDVIGERLKHVDPARVCIAVVRDQLSRVDEMPVLPKGLHHLRLVEGGGRLSDLSCVADQRALRSLFIKVWKRSFDAGTLALDGELRRFDLKADGIKNPGGLAKSTKMRHLSILDVGDLNDVGFLASMPELRTLHLFDTKVADLSPIEKLNSLVEVNTDCSRVAKLPRAALPALRRFSSFGGYLPDEEADAFARLNPKCRMTWSHARILQEATKGATRLRVTVSRARKPGVTETPIDTTDKAKIAALVASLRFDEKSSNLTFYLDVRTSVRLEFFCGKERVADVSSLDGRMSILEWVAGWPGQVPVASLDEFHRRLADLGYADPQRAPRK